MYINIYKYIKLSSKSVKRRQHLKILKLPVTLIFLFSNYPKKFTTKIRYNLIIMPGQIWMSMKSSEWLKNLPGRFDYFLRVKKSCILKYKLAQFYFLDDTSFAVVVSSSSSQSVTNLLWWGGWLQSRDTHCQCSPASHKSLLFLASTRISNKSLQLSSIRVT